MTVPGTGSAPTPVILEVLEVGLTRLGPGILYRRPDGTDASFPLALSELHEHMRAWERAGKPDLLLYEDGTIEWGPSKSPVQFTPIRRAGN